ncbi:hypothetical protein [Kitasatospora sp. NBC_00458]|uniref:hypothetical protein n=1 Tax=Kitasatospora sp. NBC_00458 TaxID=2903568 RepID=UPI002E19B9EE
MPVENGSCDGSADGVDGFEDEFARALRGAASLAPEAALFTLAAGAERVGRRRRGRRRAVLAGGLAAVVLAAGSVGLLADGTAADVFGPSGERVRPMTSEEVVGLVTGLLPPGSVTVLAAETPGVAGPSGNVHETFGVLLFDDGKGASLVSYSVERGSRKPEEAAVCLDPFSIPKEGCDRSVAPDGSVTVIDKLRDVNVTGLRKWQAARAEPDGTVVRVTEYNGQPAAPNREAPPLVEEQLGTMMSAPEWDRVVAALPADPKAPKAKPAQVATPSPGAPAATPGPDGSTPAAPELVAALAGVLPPGAEASGQDAEHGTLLVTYEGRTSMLAVQVQPAGARGLEERKYAEEGPPTPLEVREKPADGTLVVTNRFGNGKTAVDPVLHWLAAVYYPDGRSVTVSEWNGENGYTFRPGTPALSPEQLKAVATAPVWRN